MCFQGIQRFQQHFHLMTQPAGQLVQLCLLFGKEDMQRLQQRLDALAEFLRRRLDVGFSIGFTQLLQQFVDERADLCLSDRRLSFFQAQAVAEKIGERAKAVTLQCGDGTAQTAILQIQRSGQ